MLRIRLRALSAPRVRRCAAALTLITLLAIASPGATAENPRPSSGTLTPSAGTGSPARWPFRMSLPALHNRSEPPVSLSSRLGFGGRSGSIRRYSAVGTLLAGWYQTWYVEPEPLRPNGMAFVQTVAIHQKLVCPLDSPSAHDRNICPYAAPLDYVLRTDRNAILNALRTNPGSLWFIANEMDRRD